MKRLEFEGAHNWDNRNQINLNTVGGGLLSGE